MHTYGHDRSDFPGRFIRGTNRPCPCCIPSSNFHDHRTRARQAARAEIDAEIAELEAEKRDLLVAEALDDFMAAPLPCCAEVSMGEPCSCLQDFKAIYCCDGAAVGGCTCDCWDDDRYDRYDCYDLNTSSP